MKKAHKEYEKHRKEKLSKPTAVEKHFANVENKVKRLEVGKKVEGRSGNKNRNPKIKHFLLP